MTRALAFAVLLFALPAAAEPNMMAYRDTYLTWEASSDPNVNGYFVFRQDGDAAGAWEHVAMTRGYTGALLTLPRCKLARFAIHEMRLDGDPMRYHPWQPDVTVRIREPGPWREWCGDPDANGDGRVSAGDVLRQQLVYGRRLVGDEWVR